MLPIPAPPLPRSIMGGTGFPSPTRPRHLAVQAPSLAGDPTGAARPGVRVPRLDLPPVVPVGNKPTRHSFDGPAPATRGRCPPTAHAPLRGRACRPPTPRTARQASPAPARVPAVDLRRCVTVERAERDVPCPVPGTLQGLGTVVSLAYAGAETNDRRGSRWGGMPGGMSAACGVKGSADNLATCRPEGEAGAWCHHHMDGLPWPQPLTDSPGPSIPATVAGLPALSLTRPTESGRASRTNKHDPPGRVRGRAARLLHWW